MSIVIVMLFFFQAEDGIRDLVRSRGLGDVYKRQSENWDREHPGELRADTEGQSRNHQHDQRRPQLCHCLLYTSDAADERSSVDLGGRRIIKKKKMV